MKTELTQCQQLFNYYINLKFKEMREEITGFKKMNMKGVKLAIKVIFQNSEWLKVYQKIKDLQGLFLIFRSLASKFQ